VSVAACADETCPVPSPDGRTDAVTGHLWARGTSLARGHPTHLSPAGFGPAGAGRAARFSPLTGVSHAYVARVETAALLETALRDVGGPDRTVYPPMLAGWSWGRVTTTADLRLADLRDGALAALEIRPDQLTTCSPRHYRCTGAWASALHTAGFDGAVWHSRQATMHRDALNARGGGLAAALLTHVAVEVAAVWSPPADQRVLVADPSGPPRPLLDEDGRPDQLVLELAVLLDITVEA